jgi:hypothetical protein
VATNLLEGSLERPRSEPCRFTLEVGQEADHPGHMGNTTHGESVQTLQSCFKIDISAVLTVTSGLDSFRDR